MAITRHGITDTGEHTFDSITGSDDVITHGYYLTATGHPVKTYNSTYIINIEEILISNEISLVDTISKNINRRRTIRETIALIGNTIFSRTHARRIKNHIGLSSTLYINGRPTSTTATSDLFVLITEVVQESDTFLNVLITEKE